MSTIEDCWERGESPSEEAMNLARALRDVDELDGGGCLDLRFGGDGDNGEHLAWLLHFHLDRDRTVPGWLRAAAAEKLAELGGDIPAGAEGRDLAFAKLEEAIGFLQFLAF